MISKRLVCDCLDMTKDKYKYFSIGHNGHCHGSMSFHGNRRNNEAGCIDTGEHSAGLADHEYVYQIKADAATRKKILLYVIVCNGSMNIMTIPSFLRLETIPIISENFQRFI